MSSRLHATPSPSYAPIRKVLSSLREHDESSLLCIIPHRAQNTRQNNGRRNDILQSSLGILSPPIPNDLAPVSRLRNANLQKETNRKRRKENAASARCDKTKGIVGFAWAIGSALWRSCSVDPLVLGSDCACPHALAYPLAAAHCDHPRNPPATLRVWASS